ncbi:MAG: hypothetical protein NVSMB6_26630 [Burkholderiaceae bacterium]
MAVRSQEALAVYHEADDNDCEDAFSRFTVQDTHTALRLDRGIKSATVCSLLSQWYAKELWDEPSAASLARYMEQFQPEE